MRTKILELLEENSRYSVADMALMLGLTEEEVASTIKALEDEKVICGYKTLINWEKVDHKEMVTALIEVKVTPQRGEGFDKIAERIYRFSEVKAVYLMSGGFDLTVIIEGRTMKEVALFVGQKLAPLEAVLSTGTHFVLKKYKDHGVIFEEMKKDERMIVSP
ncbi:Lrp/AsnC family transcriptional regulator [Niameybacter massiliensis]|uniref:Lrp/AsnC family transcriptional regulator n=1 Tax=Holtiella tumoricola TaxID=3018743 RepID=A0AA42DRP7_9FIRM|nr:MULTISPECIES: Lrp/AsnC family transcriptional regulator [Lachnospirales]MDA3733836.1 Lrp/AsnC family transcriptional regulator [Holtiella tumoricola]